jgi:hypothetical protein
MQSGRSMPCNTKEKRVVLNAEGKGVVVDSWESHFATCPGARLARRRKASA